MGTIRRFDLDGMTETYQVKTFVETGTLYGDGVDFALEYNFDRIVSIEIDHDLAEGAKKKYQNQPKVSIVEGNSFDILASLIPTIQTNCLFWLDAHFPGADIGKSSYEDEKNMDVRLPLERELNLIYDNRRNFADVIIADDLWLYEDEEMVESGPLDKHFQKCGIKATRKNVVSGKNLDFIRDKMLDRFDLQKFYGDQGYIVLLPL